MKGIFGLKKDKELNTIEGLPVRIFVPRITSWRGAFLVFKEKSNIVCKFDFGSIGSASDVILLFTINDEDKISLNFPLELSDKRVIQAGTIETQYPFGISREILHLVKNKEGEIVLGFPVFEKVKLLESVYIKTNGFVGIPNLQVALFSVKNKEDENIEDFLVFSYHGKTMEKASYFLVISVKSIENAYEGIQFFFPQNLKRD